MPSTAAGRSRSWIAPRSCAWVIGASSSSSDSCCEAALFRFFGIALELGGQWKAGFVSFAIQDLRPVAVQFCNTSLPVLNRHLCPAVLLIVTRVTAVSITVVL